MLDKKIQVIGPLDIVVSIAIHVPYMRYPLFFEVLVHTPADTDQAILVSTAKPQYFDLLLGCLQVRQQLGVRKPTKFIGIRSRRHSTNISKSIDMRKADVQGLAATHGQPRECAMFAVGVNRIM